MSMKLSAKEVKENNRVVTIPYCDAQHLLQFERKIGYTCGVYGWNSDIIDCGYRFGNAVISTGYRPISGIYPSRELVKEYDDKARAILNDWKDDTAERVHALFNEFMRKVFEEAHK